MKVAIIHYWFITRRGGEKVVESILKLYPNADIYTLFYDKSKYGNYLNGHKVYTSILDNKFFRKHYQQIFPLYPLGIRSLKLKKNYDLIISSESGPAKGVFINNNAPHICYIHSPMRYVWSHQKVYLKSANYFLRPIMSFFFSRLKEWDKTTVNNVDLYIANSNNVANRVKEYYQRKAEIVYPPIANSIFDKPIIKNVKEYYLSFGALTPYKKIDLLVDAFNANGKSLIIVGEGSEKEKLIQKANKNIQFISCPSWNEVEAVFYKSKALIFPGEEDFGMIPLEVMAYGIPVIAFSKGGALETVVENTENIEKSSGLFFPKQSITSINKIINDFEKIENKFDAGWIRNHAKKFKEYYFLENFKKIIDKFLQSFLK
ncbi:MAG: Glycogen synthase [Flavobacterium sp. SCGC AAA160-P02]|nr:MAG: Glycogen synthase [Flavobacterium sp. SCGC AAA160-P02]